jgi:hypothetical protein
MGSDGSRYISKQVKAETAASGFRIKSGWATVVLLTGPIGSPPLCDNRTIDLSDPRVPETLQPYHATFGQLETDAKKTTRRARIVQRITTQSITDLLSDYREKGYSITRASLVIGSQLNPASIANPHIRAHALEGQLFRSAVEQALKVHGIRTFILLERDAYDKRQWSLKNPAGIFGGRYKILDDSLMVPGGRSKNSPRSLRGFRLARGLRLERAISNENSRCS